MPRGEARDHVLVGDRVAEPAALASGAVYDGPMNHCLGVPLLLALTACGVPEAQYQAARSDAAKEKAARSKDEAEIAAAQKEIGLLRTKVAQTQGPATPNGNACDAGDADELKRQKEAAEARGKLFDEFVKKFQKMIDAGKLDITTRRGQIVLALDTDVLFDEGKTDVKADGKTALTEVADALRGLKNRRFQVAGHTDAAPIKTKEFPSNWELSSARAIAVVKLLISKGVRPEVLSAAAHAEFDPAESNASNKGRAKNRRIEIVLVPNVEELIKVAEKKPAK